MAIATTPNRFRPITKLRLTLDGTSISTQIDELLRGEHPVHPFEQSIEKERFDVLFANYLAMSAAFPYLQAGAQRDLIVQHIVSDTEISADEEITLAVGAFLISDETSVNHALLTGGLPALPGILNTGETFHSSLLRADIRTIVGHPIAASFSPATRDYLLELQGGLASAATVRRVAFMVAFEAHAERMISGLWDRIDETFATDREDLEYFRTHIGGPDPAEAYHVAMTEAMIAKTVSKSTLRWFQDELLEAYAVNVEWCLAISTDSGLSS